jgi:tRNA dimethylallyltransferase
MSRPQVLVVVGPTAIGKSSLAERLACEWGGEIVSIDSAQVYRGMDVGTAKPDQATRLRIPHHLIDVTSPDQPYSAVQWAKDAQAAVNAIVARGRRPILCGGTMLYLRALLWGFDEMPGADEQVRNAIRNDARRDGWPAQHAKLAAIDPETAARLAPNDSQRIERAIEVFALTGKTLSAIHTGQRDYQLDWDVLQLGLLPTDRKALHDRIATRFQSMVNNGLYDEVRALRAAYPTLTADHSSMRCVGYRQAWESMEGQNLHADEWIERGIFATRQLAKRQITWLRSWRDLTVIDAAQDCYDIARRHMQQRGFW